ncbi:modular serine protease-like [Rhopalosiphum padi]|uniref:modular serine protease-like n=1 Tax=Rhopalosiphum padi TaxID=40932 RepID=UPI00298DB8C3|nr:modular serine protease-like [Rhopalosiphum padi]
MTMVFVSYRYCQCFVLLYIITSQTYAAISSEKCWWTGCQLSTWAVTGCKQYNRIERNVKNCTGGSEYYCCLPDPEVTPAEDCWWTGCQSNSWAVKGCDSYNRIEKKRTACEANGFKYECCTRHNTANRNPEDTFNGANGQSIERSAICDGRADCSDGSDETNNLCAKQTCQSYTYRCKYGACVDNSAKCNGKNDCVDGSDENLPECNISNGSPKCPEHQYKCKSGQCIDRTSTCDGTQDCKDGSDETLELCKNVQCQKYTFRCKYGACVSKESKCDGVRQCADGSDEENCDPISKPVYSTIQSTSQSNTGNLCVLPNVEGVVYSYDGSDEILPHGTLVNKYRTVTENCEVGYHKAYPKGFRVCQENGKWITNSEKLCLKMCPPLLSDSLDIKCTLHGKYVNCSNLSTPDTIAIPSCKSTHTVPNGQEETPIELRCQSNGMWNNQLYRCIPYCGRPYANPQPLIENGKTAYFGSAPWNVGIYQLNKKNSNYDLICGGSIIAPNLVVSAAHCFWQKGMLSNRISVNDGLYKIAVGKFNRNFNVIDNQFTQILNVETIYLKEGYYGSNAFYAEDIAVIVLQNKISISSGVAPVCVDWNSRYNIQNGTQGKIVGWGKTEKGISSPFLLEACLPYIDHDSCRSMYKNGFENFVTFDKFCAGSSALGQGVNQGDSGAGLTFLHSDYYYLTGIVSVKDPNTFNSIAVFTGVKRHIQWIRELYNKYTSYASDSIFKSNKMVLN